MPIQLIAPDGVANTSTQGAQIEPTVQALSGGRTLFAWQSHDGGEPGAGYLASGIRARILNSDGSWDTGDFYLNDTTLGAQTAPALVSLKTGGFAAVWQSDDGADSSGSLIRFRLHDANGSGSSQDIVINSTGAGAQTAPAIAQLQSGNFVVTWQSADATGSDTDSGGIRARLISSSGTPTSPDFVINTATAGTQSDPSITALNNGGFVVTWTSQDNGDGSGSCVRARVFNANGKPSANDFILNSSTTSTQSDVRIVATETGFLAVWESNDGGEGAYKATAIRGRAFNADGNALGLDFIVNSTILSFQNNPSITALPDGRFFVTWESEDPGDIEGNCIRGRMLSSTGIPMDKDFVVNTTGISVQYAPSVSATTDGNISIGWVSYDGADGSPPLIRAVQYDALTFNGDLGSNSWHGGSFADQINGNSGDDILFGWNGTDTINGGSGSDSIFGGQGADHIDGGDGDDTVSYANDDAVIVALDNSLAFSGAALGDTISSVENIAGSAAGDDTLIGDEKNNMIFGLGGKDVLMGRAGNDTIIGGGGGDILDGGSGRDELIGGMGTDTASYSNGAAVQTSLDGSVTKTGAAAGDNYSSIESLMGSKTGWDTLSGNADNNRLTGLGGSDKLSGKAGKDLLYGGRGADKLTGGTGADKFAYAARYEGGDSITDFSSVDSFTFKSTSFGNLDFGRIDARQFQASLTNKAKLADTRFIFEKDAGILWFDGNGKAAGGLTKIATLDGAYDPTASDIVIV